MRLQGSRYLGIRHWYLQTKLLYEKHIDYARWDN